MHTRDFFTWRAGIREECKTTNETINKLLKMQPDMRNDEQQHLRKYNTKGRTVKGRDGKDYTLFTPAQSKRLEKWCDKQCDEDKPLNAKILYERIKEECTNPHLYRIGKDYWRLGGSACKRNPKLLVKSTPGDHGAHWQKYTSAERALNRWFEKLDYADVVMSPTCFSSLRSSSEAEAVAFRKRVCIEGRTKDNTYCMDETACWCFLVQRTSRRKRGTAAYGRAAIATPDGGRPGKGRRDTMVVTVCGNGKNTTSFPIKSSKAGKTRAGEDVRAVGGMQNCIMPLWYERCIQPLRRADLARGFAKSFMFWDKLASHKYKDIIWQMENDGWVILFIPDKFKTFSPLDNPLFKEIKHIYRQTPPAQRSTFRGKCVYWQRSMDEVCTRGRVAKAFDDCLLTDFTTYPRLPVPPRLTKPEKYTVTGDGVNAGKDVVVWAGEGTQPKSPFCQGRVWHSLHDIAEEDHQAYLENDARAGRVVEELDESKLLGQPLMCYSALEGDPTDGRMYVPGGI